MRQHKSLENALGVSVKDKDLLRLALAHSSYFNENPGSLAGSNERLEFLGDAIISAAVAHELYRRFPDWPEGQLTQARSVLVRGEALTAVAKRLNLGKHMYMGNGEEEAGGRERPTNLAAALEAVVGAVLLDQGYEEASKLVLRLLAPELEAVGQSQALKSPKSILQEVVQGKGLPPPAYEIVQVTGSEHQRQFTVEVTIDGQVIGQGTGGRKSQAEQEAAAAALKAMDNGA